MLSALLIAASVYVWIQQGPTKYGIDYKGGHELIVRVDGDESANSESIRNALNGKGVENAIVQSFEAVSAIEAHNDYSIRVGQEEGIGPDELKKAVLSALKENFKGEISIPDSQFVGPTIGDELKKKSMIAMIIGLLAILAYISFRFEFAFALGAVVALFHDVIICMGGYLASGRMINVATLAAALTIVGYSVNDTIIVFDRMREEILKRKDFDLIELMNYSINATLSRTVITSLLTFFSAVALLVFGGGAIADLSIFLVIGVITGTYSTIFIATPVALAWERIRNPHPKTATEKS